MLETIGFVGFCLAILAVIYWSVIKDDQPRTDRRWRPGDQGDTRFK